MAKTEAEEDNPKKTKHLKTRRLRLRDFTDQARQISFEKPEIPKKKTPEQIEKEKKEEEYRNERKAIGVRVSGGHVPDKLDLGNNY